MLVKGATDGVSTTPVYTHQCSSQTGVIVFVKCTLWINVLTCLAFGEFRAYFCKVLIFYYHTQTHMNESRSSCLVSFISICTFCSDLKSLFARMHFNITQHCFGWWLSYRVGQIRLRSIIMHGMLLKQTINTLRPRQNGHHFPDGIFECIFSDKNVWISIKIYLKFVPMGSN